MNKKKLKKVWSVGKFTTAECQYDDYNIISIIATFDTFEEAENDLTTRLNCSNMTIIERWVLE